MTKLFNKKNIIVSTSHFVMILFILLLLFGSIGFQRDGPTTKGVTFIEDVKASTNGGPWEDISLPHAFTNLPARTPVTLATTIQPNSDDCIYIKTVYTPAKIYLNDKLVFEFGKEKNYPKFMLDPAPEVHIIETYNSGEKMQLRMEFLSPVSHHSFSVQPPIIGTSKELILERSHEFGVPLILAIAQISISLCFIFISIFVEFITHQGASFFWLGLFALTSGIWFFAENNFSFILFRHSTSLYLLSFIGLCSFIVPLLHFANSIIKFRYARFIRCMEIFFAGSATIAFFLQIAGIMSLSKSMYFFYIALPIALALLTLLTIQEYFYSGNIHSGRFIIPAIALTLSAFFELINYQMHVTYTFPYIFQMGTLFFLLTIGIIVAISFKDSVYIQKRQEELDFEKHLLELQTEEHRENSLLLVKNEQLLSRQRHDLRHHLTAIQNLSNDNKALQEYIATLINNIPSGKERFCENNIVNSIISHYASLCDKNEIDFTAQLVVPETNSQSTDSDLCVIFANLLENAVEACNRVDNEQKFIRLNSKIQYDLLIITMDNSFNGEFTIYNNRFRSAKRNDYGIGLASIQSIAQKSYGDATFTPKEKVFLSSVYLQI